MYKICGTWYTCNKWYFDALRRRSGRNTLPRYFAGRGALGEPKTRRQGRNTVPDLITMDRRSTARKAHSGSPQGPGLTAARCGGGRVRHQEHVCVCVSPLRVRVYDM